jgi:hypothetical protein
METEQFVVAVWLPEVATTVADWVPWDEKVFEQVRPEPEQAPDHR